MRNQPQNINRKRPRVEPKKVAPVTAPNKINRFWFVVALLTLWMAAIGARLVDLQTTQHDLLLGKATAQRERTRKTKLMRGAILDRNGRELAVTLETQSLAVDPLGLENPEASAFKIAKILGKSPKELMVNLADARVKERRFVPLARELDAETVDQIKNLDIKSGLIWTPEQKRQYPNGNLAAHVIGFTNHDGNGQAGIEEIANDYLRGNLAETVEQRDGRGRVFDRNQTVAQSPRDVTLTIDSAIQFRVEQALAAGIAANKAKAGAAVVLNPRTGEILAMANAPDFNPNDLSQTKPDTWTNRAVQNLYEPGSTFKLVTYSAALEEKIAVPTDTIDARAGQITVGSRTIKDSGHGGVFTLTEALARSSNVAAITIGQRVGKERLYDYIRRFGFGQTTGVESPAEARGMLYAPDKWTPDSFGSVPIGYEVGVTTLQSAAAFGAIANDGVRMQPHLIKEIRADNGEIVQQSQPEQHRVVSDETARAMRQMLAAVTEEGTAKRAQLAGYTSAGKTGTAHKFDSNTHHYSDSKFVASFVGFAPVNNPVVIAVMIDEPGAGAHHGGDVAAPIFRDIAEQILPVLRIAPDAAPDAKQTLTAAVKPSPDVAPTVKTNAAKTDKTDKEPADKKTAPVKDDAKSAAQKPSKGDKDKTDSPRERLPDKSKSDGKKPPDAPTKDKRPPKTKPETAEKPKPMTKKGKP